MASRLKVFTWSDGFHAHTVATTSWPKALAAWGVKQDMFATGLAREIQSGPDHDAALKAPGTLIERAEKLQVRANAARLKAPKGLTAAQRRKIASLQRELEDVEAQGEKALDDLDLQISALETDRAAVEARLRKRVEATKTKLRAARKP